MTLNIEQAELKHGEQAARPGPRREALLALLLFSRREAVAALLPLAWGRLDLGAAWGQLEVL